MSVSHFHHFSKSPIFKQMQSLDIKNVDKLISHNKMTTDYKVTRFQCSFVQGTSFTQDPLTCWQMDHSSKMKQHAWKTLVVVRQILGRVFGPVFFQSGLLN